MKHLIIIIGLLPLLSSIRAEDLKASPASDAPGSSPLNVRNYGAAGDGVHDDTNAIQSALNAAAKESRSRTIGARHWRYNRNPGSERIEVEVVFPPGRYKITRPLVVTEPLYLRGAPDSIVEQADPAREVFYFHSIRVMRIEGLTLKGGSIQLRFWTNNLDVAQITVRNMRFLDASSYAVECRSFSSKKFTGSESELTTLQPLGPYEVEWNEGIPTMTPNDMHGVNNWFNSTVMVIADCEFKNCIGAVDMTCDTGVVRDCVIETNAAANGPIFSHPNGKTHLYRIKGLARLDPANDVYWVEGGGILSVRDCEFETDGADGIDFLRASKPVRWVSLDIGNFCIELENSRLKVGGSKHDAICWISEANQPSILSIRGITETSGKPVKAVSWQDPQEEPMLDLIPPGNVRRLKDWYRIQFSGNSSNIDLQVPDFLEPLKEEAVPENALKAAFVPELNWGMADLEKNSSKTILAASFGLEPGSSKDSSPIIQKIFDAAGEAGDAEVIFPPGIYKLSKPVNLPPRVIVRAAGRAAFAGTGTSHALFAAKHVEEIGFEGIIFSRGKDAFDLSSDNPGSNPRVAFQDCTFLDQTGAGIRFMLGDDKLEKERFGEITIRGGIMGTTQGLVTNAARSQIEDAYFINDPHLNDAAFIENLGGAMRIQSCLSIPQLWDGKRNKRPEHLKSWDYSRNTRWFDNFGKIYILDTRLGGESGGMANVFNRTKDGTVFIGGGTKRFVNGLTKKAMVYWEQIPEVTVLQDVSAVPISQDGSSAVLTARGVTFDPDRFFYSGLLAPLPAGAHSNVQRSEDSKEDAKPESEL